MAGEGFTILHASDFQLDNPLGGLRWIPEAIEDEVLAAPEVAAQRVFDLAIEHRVNMLALTGNLLCPRNSSARSLSFLSSQFARLHEHDIPVVWATGASDPLGEWPTSITWPDSTIRFDRGSLDRRVMTLGEMEVEVLGCGSDAAGDIHPKWFDGLSRGGHQMVIGGGTVDAFNNLEAAELWLLGGRSYAEHLVDGNANIFYAGIPQGRCLSDSGLRGAQLIRVSEQVERTILDCSAIRYENITIDAESINNFDELELLIYERAETCSWNSNRISLVHWDLNVKDSGNVFHNTDTEFMQWQQRFGQQSMLTSSSVFTLGVDVHYGHDNDVSVDNEDLLGDYLFALGSLRENGWSKMKLAGAEEVDEAANCWTSVQEDLAGLRTLDDAARLGELLLGGSRNQRPQAPISPEIDLEAA
jgi:DNA repair protein SbcD/Mre11